MTTHKEEEHFSTDPLINNILQAIEREREREIISRRFGLFDRKETLEQIGELLGITRERVRQLEKTIILKLKAAAEEKKIKDLFDFQTVIEQQLNTKGGVANINLLTSKLIKEPTKIEQSRMFFICNLCPNLIVIAEDDNYYATTALKSMFNEADLKKNINLIYETIVKTNEPKTIDFITQQAKLDNSMQAESLAQASKKLTSLNNKWGLIKWPLVNPKNIRDKIYVILKENGTHMHFNEIADAIKASEFKRKDVTTQAIHNELIKDKRFVLIGRGIYALKEWGYDKGTVADIISQVLREANQPLHRDEIVKRVLKNRYVKETTILLNLQGKPQFKRVAKATYELAE